MNVYVNARPTSAEKEEFDAWIRTRGNDLISKVLVEAGSVTL